MYMYKKFKMFDLSSPLTTVSLWVYCSHIHIVWFASCGCFPDSTRLWVHPAILTPRCLVLIPASSVLSCNIIKSLGRGIRSCHQSSNINSMLCHVTFVYFFEQHYLWFNVFMDSTAPRNQSTANKSKWITDSNLNFWELFVG